MTRGEYLTITINEDSGILTPETPRGFDGEAEGYAVKITFLDSGGQSAVATDKNIVVVKNPVSSTVPGATVRMELETYANLEIGSNEEIILDFSGPPRTPASACLPPSRRPASRFGQQPHLTLPTYWSKETGSS